MITYNPLVPRLPSDYRWATPYEAEMWYNQPDAVQVIRGGDRENGYETDIAVPASLPFACIREFGRHQCAGSECEAQEILYNMNPDVRYCEDHSGYWGDQEYYAYMNGSSHIGFSVY